MGFYRANANRQRISPTKVRPLANLVRGRPVEEAVNTLKFSPQAGARVLLTLLESAIANAENNFGADVDELVVYRVQVNEGMRLKRMRPRARGRGNRIIKRGSHISIVLAEEEPANKLFG